MSGTTACQFIRPSILYVPSEEGFQPRRDRKGTHALFGNSNTSTSHARNLQTPLAFVQPAVPRTLPPLEELWRAPNRRTRDNPTRATSAPYPSGNPRTYPQQVYPGRGNERAHCQTSGSRRPSFSVQTYVQASFNPSSPPSEDEPGAGCPELSGNPVSCEFDNLTLPPMALFFPDIESTGLRLLGSERSGGMFEMPDGRERGWQGTRFRVYCYFGVSRYFLSLDEVEMWRSSSDFVGIAPAPAGANGRRNR